MTREDRIVAFAKEIHDGAKDFARPAVEEAAAAGKVVSFRPVIKVIPGGLPEVVDRSEAALLADVDRPIYQRAGQLVAIVSNERRETADGIVREAGTPTIRAILPANLAERCMAAADYERFSRREKEWVRIDAPASVAAALHARGSWLFPTVVAVVQTPRLRPDGTVLEEAGFDLATGLYYRPNIPFEPVPSLPTRADAEEAARQLLEIVVDFPFESADHRAAWLAALLTPFSRPAYHGPAPLMLVDKNVHGAGGSLLADLVGLIVTGREMSRAVNPRDDEEMRKRITSSALAGDELLLIDNVTGTLGGAALNAALTGTSWRDRILGASEMTPALPLVATWYATSNNATVDRDTTRRALPIRLDSPLEHPEERDNFRHPNLRAYVLEERPRLVRCALTVLRAYYAAGRPRTPVKPWGSYEGWSDSVRQAVVFAGLTDPCRTRMDFVTAADTERTALVALLDGLEELDPFGHGQTAPEILRRLDRSPDEHRGLREAILELCPQKDGKPFLPTARQLGRRLGLLRRRVVGDRMVDRMQRTVDVIAWRVVRPEKEAS